MHQVLLLASVIIVLCVSAALLYAAERRRRNREFLRWAEAQGLKIVEFHQPGLQETSAFPFTISKAQQVYQFVAEDPAGTRRSGWVLLGSALFGLRSPTARVKWDDGPIGKESASSSKR